MLKTQHFDNLICVLATVTDLKSQSKRRLSKFQKKCSERAISKSQFHRHFDIDLGHIAVRAGDQNSSLRHAIQPEHMAALIVRGKLNFQQSKDTNRIEIAVEGVFRNFKYIEFGTPQTTAEITIKNLQIRIIVRDGIRKLMIVTIYQLGQIDKTLPEVEYELW